MRFRRWIATFLILWSVAGHSSSSFTNQLKNHSSPYLALHGDDPVAWQEWNAATVERARKEGKLLYVSIGYFSCHWCHVMQKESYRNPEIARFLNAHFVPVKVDRELEPALDQRLIDFAEKTRGVSGWPLNAFVTPEGHPLYATLYHPPAEFMKVVVRIDSLWRDDRKRLAQLATIEDRPPEGPGRPEIAADRAQQNTSAVVRALMAEADRIQGGFGEQSKFPFVPQLGFLLDQQRLHPTGELKDFLTLTLDTMAMQGLWDRLGGGFFRYTVDPSWKTPHFEKMLYDNAQLAALYARAAGTLGRTDYRDIAFRTLDFMIGALRLPGGGFAASLSALDDRGVEGGYYLFSDKELESSLSPAELAAYRQSAAMEGHAPFDSGWLPVTGAPVAAVATALKRNPDEVRRLIRSAEDKLRAVRERRRAPRDPKVLAAWNGLALTALATVAAEPGGERFRAAGSALRNLLERDFWNGTQLIRSRTGSVTGGTAALEDYAYTARGIADWGRLTGSRKDLELAVKIARVAWKKFYTAKGWRLEERSLLATGFGQDLVPDSHLPSASAVLIDTSLVLAQNLNDAGLRRQALAAANSGQQAIRESPFWHASTVAIQSREAIQR